MKKIAILSLAAILTTSCKGQDKNEKDFQKNDSLEQISKAPQGTWKVDKEFDEHGNLIRYDSIYSWSSSDNYRKLAETNPDSLLRSFQSKFYRDFKGFDKQGFHNLFADDSLFTQRFFNEKFFESEFGEDFIDIDRIRERMETMQHQFLKKYQSRFDSIGQEGPEDME